MAVVVAYFPDENLKARIEALVGQVDAVLIVDNTPSGWTSNWTFLENPDLAAKVSLRALGRNSGVAAALNVGVREARRGNFDYLLTLDQDSVVPAGAVATLRKVLSSGRDIAVACPLFHQRDTGRRSFLPVKRQVLVLKRIQPGTGVYDVYATITSGSLYKMEVLDMIGGFPEEYFIDCVDNELCLRMWRNGFRVVVTAEVDIPHYLGRRRNVTKGGLTFSPTNYPPTRHYYMIRNRLFLYKKYCLRFPLYVVYDMTYVIVVLIRVICAERGRREKLRMMRRGLLDGLRGRGGACRWV